MRASVFETNGLFESVTHARTCLERIIPSNHNIYTWVEERERKKESYVKISDANGKPMDRERVMHDVFIASAGVILTLFFTA